MKGDTIILLATFVLMEIFYFLLVKYKSKYFENWLYIKMFSFICAFILSLFASIIYMIIKEFKWELFIIILKVLFWILIIVVPIALFFYSNYWIAKKFSNGWSN